MPASVLPPELWFIVFDLATFTPHSFDFGVRNNFMRPRKLDYRMGTFMFDMECDMRTVRKALTSKRAISQVCRGWHELVKPLLYEVLSLVCAIDCASLTTQIGGTKLDSGLGRYTRRLDVVVPRELDTVEDACTTTAFENSLRQLIGHLPLLEILIIYAPQVWMKLGLLEPLVNTCSSTIRKIVWESEDHLVHYDVEDYGFGCLYQLIERAPRLATLLIAPLRMRSECLALTDVTMRASLTCSLPVADSQNQNSEYTMHHRPGYAFVSHAAFFPTISGDTIYLRYPMHPASAYVERLVGIRKAVFYVPFREELLDPPDSYIFALPAGVTHIGLYFSFVQAANRVYAAMRAMLDYITRLGYTPRTVRFLDEKIVFDLTRKHRGELRRMIESAWQFRLEDHNGHLLQIPPTR